MSAHSIQTLLFYFCMPKCYHLQLQLWTTCDIVTFLVNFPGTEKKKQRPVIPDFLPHNLDYNNLLVQSLQEVWFLRKSKCYTFVCVLKTLQNESIVLAFVKGQTFWCSESQLIFKVCFTCTCSCFHQLYI